MIKIDSILENNSVEAYSRLLAKLQEVLIPFAQIAIGQTPVYFGQVVHTAGVASCDSGCCCSFVIDDNVLATVSSDGTEASVFECERFALQPEDRNSVIQLLTALKKKKQPSETPPTKALGALPPELQTLMGILIKGSNKN